MCANNRVALINTNFIWLMLKKATCFATLLLMAACSSGSVTDQSTDNKSSDDSSKEQLSADRSGIEAYEQNDITLSGEQNNNDFVNKLDDKAVDVVESLLFQKEE